MSKHADDESERLYKRGRVWWGWFSVTEPGPDGKPRKRRIIVSTGCREKAAARKKLEELEREGRDPAAAKRKRATLKTAIDLLIADRKSRVPEDGIAKKKSDRSQDTVDAYEKCALNWYLYAGRRLEAIADDVPADTVDKDRKVELRELGKTLALADAGDHNFVDEFILYRRGACGAGESTIAKDRTTFRAALRLAKRKGLWVGDIEHVFPRGFETGYEPKKRHLTWDEVTKLLAAFDHAPNRKALVAYMICFAAEWRAVQRARMGDVTKDSDLVPVRGTKKATRDRWVGVVADWQRELLPIILAGMDGKEGKLFSHWGSCRRAIAAACVRADVPHFSPHPARHTYVHLMKLEGLTHVDLYGAIGHADTRMLDAIYGRTDGAELAELQRRRIAERRATLTVIEGGKSKSA